MHLITNKIRSLGLNAFFINIKEDRSKIAGFLAAYVDETIEI